jgi:hypothetical protein
MRKYNLFVTFVGVFVLVLMAIGFSVVGTPDVQRGRTKDATTMSNLKNISFEIDSYYKNNSALPSNLNLLGNAHYLLLTDPESNQPYGYHIRNKVSYDLCANFSTEVLVPDNTNRYDNLSPTQKMHKKGYDCIVFSISDFLQNIVNQPTQIPSSNYVSPTTAYDRRLETISPSPSILNTEQYVKDKKKFSSQWLFSFEYPSNWLFENEGNATYLYAPNSSNPDAGRFGSYPRVNVSSAISTTLELSTWFNDQHRLDPNLPRTGNEPTIRRTFVNTHGVKVLEVDAFTDMGITQYYFKSGNNVITLTPLYKQAESGGLLHDQDQVYKDIIDSITLM